MLTNNQAAVRSGRGVRYGGLDDMPPSAEWMQAQNWTRDLTQEGIEPNPGWTRKGKEKSWDSDEDTASLRRKLADSNSSNKSSKSYSDYSQADYVPKKRKEWRVKERKGSASGKEKKLYGELADVCAKLAAKDDPLKEKLREKKEEREDQRWKWEIEKEERRAAKDRYETAREEAKLARLPQETADEDKKMEYQRWKETQEMEEDKREAEKVKQEKEQAEVAYQARLDAIAQTLGAHNGLVRYWWGDKAASLWAPVTMFILSVVFALFSEQVYLHTRNRRWIIDDLSWPIVLASGMASFLCAIWVVHWIAFKLGRNRYSFSFRPQEMHVMEEEDLRPDAQGVGKNVHLTPLYVTGTYHKRRAGVWPVFVEALFSKPIRREYLISLELLSQFLNANVLDIDASFVEKRSRVARIARTCHSINLNRFNNVIKKNVVEDTARFALAAVMDRDRRMAVCPFRIPLSEPLPASAPTWRV